MPLILDETMFRAYSRRMADEPAPVKQPLPQTPASKHGRRRPASGAEQAHRVAWGHKYGPLVGRTIREAIQRAEA